MSLLLVAVGGVFALLFALLSIIQTIRRQSRIGFVQLLLAFLALLVPLAGLIMDQLGDEPLPAMTRLALVVAALAVVPGVIVLLLELRRPERLKTSRGLLGLGVGLLLAISTFTVPVIAENQLAEVRVTPTSPVLVARAEETDSPAEPTVTLMRTPTPTLTMTPTQTRTPRATPTPSPTRFRFATRTPAPTATLPNPCLAIADYNLNLRAEPDLEAELVATIPYNTTVTLFGRNTDSTWWYGRYEGQTGWLKGEFLTLSASCEALPERR